MDIAKIRKKALSKKMEEKAAEVLISEELPLPEEEKKESPPQESAPSVQEEAEASVTSRSDEASGTEPPVGTVDEPDSAGDEDGEAPEEKMIELLTFSIYREEYAFRVPEVEEVLRFQQITAVPTAPDYVLGITSLRGKIIPVIDLKKRLNLGKTTPDLSGAVTGGKKALEKKIVIIAGPNGLIGALIDNVTGVVRLPLSRVLPPPGHLDETGLVFIDGIIVLNKRFISVIHSDTAMDIEAG